MTQVGELRKRLVLQAEGLVPDGTGGQTSGWTTLGEIWADVVPVSGSMALAANYDRRLTHTIRMRFRHDLEVTSGMRLLDGNRVFTIRAVTNRNERNRWLDILAEEGGMLG